MNLDNQQTRRRLATAAVVSAAALTTYFLVKHYSSPKCTADHDDAPASRPPLTKKMTLDTTHNGIFSAPDDEAARLAIEERERVRAGHKTLAKVHGDWQEGRRSSQGHRPIIDVDAAEVGVAGDDAAAKAIEEFERAQNSRELAKVHGSWEATYGKPHVKLNLSDEGVAVADEEAAKAITEYERAMAEKGALSKVHGDWGTAARQTPRIATDVEGVQFVRDEDTAAALEQYKRHREKRQAEPVHGVWSQ